MTAIEERCPETRRYAGLAGDGEGVNDERPPLLLLHGLSFDRTMWAPARTVLRRIDPGRRMLALDLPGHGASTGHGAVSEAVATAVHQAVRAAGLAAPIVVGDFYSAILATFYAAEYPSSGVVNVDQRLLTTPFVRLLQSHRDELYGHGFASEWAMLTASMHPEQLPPDAHRLVGATSRPEQELLLAYWREVLEHPAAELAARLDAALAVLRARNVPYLVVSGHQPEARYRQWLAEMLPQATVTEWANSGHFPHLAHPERFARHLQATGAWIEGPVLPAGA
jgi:pimeloyl-ACP methyl ester carboxylesterase